MNIFSVAEKLTPTDRPPVTLDANRCVHAYDKLADCDLCVRVCPVNALQLSTNVSLDEKACVACGLCLHQCPVGAYTGDDGGADLFELIARFPDASIVELACLHHPAPERGPIENAIVIRAKTCLAALGPSRYLQLATLVPQVVVRMDACAACLIGRAQPEIARAIDAAHNVLMTCDESRRIAGILEKPEPEIKTRAVYDAKNPPVSRRDLFRLLAVGGTKAVGRVLSSDNQQPAGKSAPPERRRLLNALEQLAPEELSKWQSTTPAELGIVWFEADKNCTACGVCARACPTGAIQFAESGENQYRLAFAISRCTNCGVCVDMCEPSALHHANASTFAELVAGEPRVLRAGGLKKCNRCNVKYDDRIEGNLCPMCRYRINNPFGSRLLQTSKKQRK